MNEPQAITSADELARAGLAELASLDAFVRADYPRVVRLAGLITRDSEQAQDAVQDFIPTELR